jgi:hypothetical protein
MLLRDSILWTSGERLCQHRRPRWQNHAFSGLDGDAEDVRRNRAAREVDQAVKTALAQGNLRQGGAGSLLRSQGRHQIASCKPG